MFSHLRTRFLRRFCRTNGGDVPSSRGFTITELLVVLFIIGVMSTVVIAQYNNFDSISVLRNLAYEVALSVREAQVLTISTSNITNTGFANSGQNSYGIHFVESSQTYTIFVDNDADDVFDTSPNETVKSYTLSQGASITKVAAIAGGSTHYPVTADITFTRPHLDTTFVTNPAYSGITEVVIEVTSRRGGSKKIHVHKSGRIWVE
jgi:prepilin-type N-terminal cleavage/methylation domain-containing protein